MRVLEAPLCQTPTHNLGKFGGKNKIVRRFILPVKLLLKLFRVEFLAFEKSLYFKVVMEIFTALNSGEIITLRNNLLLSYCPVAEELE